LATESNQLSCFIVGNMTKMFYIGKHFGDTIVPDINK